MQVPVNVNYAISVVKGTSLSGMNRNL